MGKLTPPGYIPRLELSKKEQRVAVFEDTMKLISSNSDLSALTEKAKQYTKL